MAEKLTDEERAALEGVQDQNLDAPWFGVKALRIINQLTEALAAAEQRAEVLRRTSMLVNLSRAAYFDEQCVVNLNRVETAEREVARLTEALAAAQEESDGLHIQCDREHAAWAREKRRAEAAERALAEARADLDARVALVDSVDAFRASAQPATPLSEDLGTALVQVIDAERAAAPAQPKQSEMTEDEYYAYQPAAPAAPDPLLGRQIGPGAVAPCNQPAAPARTEALSDQIRSVLSDAGYHMTTEAEQRVLDAMAAIPEEHLREAVAESDYPLGIALVRAELVRRGLR